MTWKSVDYANTVTRKLFVKLGSQASVRELVTAMNTTPEFRTFRNGDEWAVEVTMPKDIFHRNVVIQWGAIGQYQKLIMAEEQFHVDQWEGKVALDKGGCGDLFTDRSVEYYLEPKPERVYDGKVIFDGYADEPSALKGAKDKWQTALKKASDEGWLLRKRRACFREKMAKLVVGWTEAYTYECSYPDCPANPDPHPSPWTE